MIFRPFYRFEAGCAAYVFGGGIYQVGAAVPPKPADMSAILRFNQGRGL
jgi:hypothetical protein